ncbi:hypothetical protein RHGRI_018065 [Rhododendron griersonianum]|uniref:Uncharacterized protein n=1 Tax=Rhododendron griersonianum TaxID=479676 RepID=A0AAV6K046_9ERIC|nr:hypothetical protein RHGRI_018065 [Rhododendron griersonianum]
MVVIIRCNTRYYFLEVRLDGIKISLEEFKVTLAIVHQIRKMIRLSKVSNQLKIFSDENKTIRREGCNNNRSSQWDWGGSCKTIRGNGEFVVVADHIQEELGLTVVASIAGPDVDRAIYKKCDVTVEKQVEETVAFAIE